MRCGVIACLALAALTACSSGVPKPPIGPVPNNALTTDVPYPPPPAHVEEIPRRKSDRDVWVDGRWDWAGNDWKWIPGQWVTPPAGAYFTPWALTRTRDGRLVFTPAAWRRADGQAVDVGNGSGICPAPAPSASAGQVAAAP